MGRIVAVCISEKKGTPKTNIERGILKKDYGFVGDAHAGKWHRQVSLLAKESLEEIEREGMKIGCGGFGENLTTEEIELTSLVIGTRLKIAEDVLLEVTQIGKECKKPCAIYREKGFCLLPSQGMFTKVLVGGEVRIGDKIKVTTQRGFIPAGIVTISDSRSRGRKDDESGKWLKENLGIVNSQAVRYTIIPDDEALISRALTKWSDEKNLELILTTGGTGFSPRDFTPEATRRILDREAPGLQEMLRAEGAKGTKFAYLSRGIAGIRGGTLIINLPGSLKAVKEALQILRPILPHALQILRGETPH